MAGEHRHASDETLLLYAEGALAPVRATQTREHIAACAGCRARMEQIQSTLAVVAEAQRQAHSSELTPADQARAALIARMSELRAASPRNSRLAWANPAAISAWRGYALALVILIAVSLVAIYRRELKSQSQQVSASLGLWPEPKSNLTPGMVLPVSKAQLCSGSAGLPAPPVPDSLQRKVFAIYGMNDAPANAYEVDYLITPQLGGATDIRNLWPEPYFDTAWNAHVKDQLEDRLYQMVCHDEVDLATAQQDISKDWIAAYRKYFHTENPLANSPHDRL
jgi:hypothetical protein